MGFSSWITLFASESDNKEKSYFTLKLYSLFFFDDVVIKSIKMSLNYLEWAWL